MTIGAGILLFVIGAILAFAVEVDLQVIDGVTLGYILMLAGVIVAILSFAMGRRGVRHETVTTTAPAAPAREPAPGETVERRTERRDGI